MTRKPASDSDGSYKHIFSCPEIVRDLLKGYVPGKWLKHVDFSTLVHVSSNYVSESGKQRYGDTVWRVNISGQWIWVYIITEFESRQPDQWMALRMMEYVTQLALQITREHKKHALPDGRVPPIIPIVIYNGEPVWNAATDAADCFIDPPGGLEAYKPRLRYLLLDAHRLKLNRTKEVRNFAEALFRMEANHGKYDMFTVMRTLADMLNAPELKSLHRAFNVWIKELLKRRAPDNKIREEIDGFKDVIGGHEMVEAVYENWGDAYRKEGELKGKASLLVRQLTRRFGPLPEWAEARVNKAKPAQLDKWGDAVLDASTLKEALGAPGRR
jgi:hypothetical protein